jgi:hypothetical protein
MFHRVMPGRLGQPGVTRRFCFSTWPTDAGKQGDRCARTGPRLQEGRRLRKHLTIGARRRATQCAGRNGRSTEISAGARSALATAAMTKAPKATRSVSIVVRPVWWCSPSSLAVQPHLDTLLGSRGDRVAACAAGSARQCGGRHLGSPRRSEAWFSWSFSSLCAHGLRGWSRAAGFIEFYPRTAT